MSRIRANIITNRMANGAPTVQNGLVISGVTTSTSFSGDGSALTGIDATQIVTGNTSVQTVDTGSDGHVKINTEGSERARIDSSGRLGIGTASGTRGINVEGTGNAARAFFNDSSNHKAVEFGADSNGSFQSTIGDNPHLIYTNGTERARFTSSGIQLPSGNGIDFSATGDGSAATSVAEILDDYEEGLFTPYMAYSTTQNDFAYSGQVGQYVKIGKLVTFQARVNLTSAGSGSGNVKFTNFPFAPSPSSGTLSNPQVVVKPIVGVDVGGDREIFAQFEGGQTSIYLYTFGIESSSDYATFTSSNIDNDAQVAVFGHYYTDS